MTAAWTLLAAILACGGSSDDDDAPPPVAPGTNSAATTGTPTPNGAVVVGGVQGTFTLTPGFTPTPQTSTGTAGGPFEASTRSPACRGWIGAVSNHTLNLSQPFTNLRLIVNAPRDTTLVVQLANGTYLCDDDTGEGMNPLVQAAFPAGLHRVFIGSYQANTQTSYTLAVTEDPSFSAARLGGGVATGIPSAVPPPPSGATAALSLTPGFLPDPITARGTAGGSLAASTLDPRCRGHIPMTPQHTVTLQSDFRNLRAIVHSAQDTTLVVRGPNGVYQCEDDSEGFNPIVTSSYAPGVYQIWVGTYSANGAAPYVIGFSELPSTTAAGLGF